MNGGMGVPMLARARRHAHKQLISRIAGLSLLLLLLFPAWWVWLPGWCCACMVPVGSSLHVRVGASIPAAQILHRGRTPCI